MRRVVNGSFNNLSLYLRFSTVSRSYRRPHSKAKGPKNKTQEPRFNGGQPEPESTISLLKEINSILGTGDVVPGNDPFGFSVSELGVESSRVLDGKCAEGVCENSEEKWEALDRGDIGEAVDRIAEIVRAGDGAVPMEERLSEVRVGPEVVEDVLKSCSKVPHLAFRYFTWVKGRDGFCHNTRTYNVMLCMAGEAKEFLLLDRLLAEMENDSCGRDVKTWTDLITQYAGANLVGKALSCIKKMRKCGCEPDAKVYRVMVQLLCDAGKFETALEFHKEMVRRNVELNLVPCKMLLHGLATSGDLDSVRLVVDDIVKVSLLPEHDVYVSVFRSLCAAGRIREALELIQDLKSKRITMDYEFFEILVRGLCMADRIEDALEVVEIMEKMDMVDGKVYEIIMSRYMRRKELTKALDMFERMKERAHWPSTATCTELLQLLFNSNQYHEACNLYDEMLEAGLDIDSVAIMAVVSGHVLQNNVSKAWEVFRTMDDKGIRPTWKSFSTYIKALCIVARTDEMLKILQEMQDLQIPDQDEIFEWVISCMEKKGEMDNIRNVKGLQRTYKLQSMEHGSQIRKELVQKETGAKCNWEQPVELKSDCLPVNKQDVQEACRILSSSKDWSFVQEGLEKCTFEFTPELVVEILRNYSRHGNVALHFFSWVGGRNSYKHTTGTYNMAIKIAGRGKDFKCMRTLFCEMRRAGCEITPDTWAIMILQYGRTGMTEIALKIFSEMKALGYDPSYSTYKCLVTCLCERKGRKVDEAIRLFQKMIRAGHTPEKELVETYLACLCEEDRLPAARGCVDSLLKVGFRAAVGYSLYVRALCRAGRIEQALSLVDKIDTERTTLDKYTFGSLIHGLLRKGKLEQALARIDSMKQAGILPTSHVYTSLIVHFFREKQPAKALEIFDKMQKEGCSPTIVTYYSLIRGYMDNGRVADARDLFRGLKANELSPDFKTYSMFISCLCKEGKSEEALQLLSEMQEDGIVPSDVNFKTVFFGLNREGKHSKAQIVCKKKSALKSQRQFLT